MTICYGSSIDFGVNANDTIDEIRGLGSNSNTTNNTNELTKDADTIDFNTVCRVVASGDRKLPYFRSLVSMNDPETVELYDKIDAFYHAKSHKETSNLKYLQENSYNLNEDKAYIPDGVYHSQKEQYVKNNYEYDYEEEKQLVATLKTSLEDAGFELLNRRDLDLCEALNVGYLLRLSIVPTIKNLDPLVGEEFYPNTQMDEEEMNKKADQMDDDDQLLFDGRVLVFRRGYSEEVSRGRLLLPKLDYLQASIVQKSASAVADTISAVEGDIESQITKSSQTIKKSSRESLYKAADSITKKRMSNFLQKSLGFGNETDKDDSKKSDKQKGGNRSKKIQLARYAGNKIRFVGAPDGSDALTEFLLCEINDNDPISNADSVNEESANDSEIVLPVSSLDENVPQENKILYAGLESGKVGCNYDTIYPPQPSSSVSSSSSDNSFRLLERVSISNVVDFFSKEGRRRFVKSFISKSELVEPTYEEVVVIWRQLLNEKKPRPKLRPPKAIYDVAEVFAIDDRLPPKPQPPLEPPPQPLQIRVFNEVPMANLPAVLPETRLIFRPADAFLFDFVSVLTLLAVLATQRYDNPKLDLIALISVSLWLLRTILRYSNKLARYDLLVNKFLTSKLSQKGTGAFNYILSEASKQRATRAGLVHNWLLNTMKKLSHQKNEANSTPDSSKEIKSIQFKQLEEEGNVGVNELLQGDHTINININMALKDLKDLNLIESTKDGVLLHKVHHGSVAFDNLKKKWVSLFEEESNSEIESALKPELGQESKNNLQPSSKQIALQDSKLVGNRTVLNQTLTADTTR